MNSVHVGRFVASGAILGILIAIVGLPLYLSGSWGGAFALSATVAIIMGALGGAIAGLATGVLTLLFRGKDVIWTDFLRVSIAGPLAAGVLTYLVFFNRQTSYSPMILILGPAVPLAVAFAIQLWRGRQSRTSGANGSVVGRETSGSFIVLASSVVSTCVVFLSAYLIAPAAYPGGSIGRDFPVLAESDRIAIVARLIGMIIVAIAVTVGTTLGRRLFEASSILPASATWALLASGSILINSMWLVAPVDEGLLYLHNVVPADQPLPAILTALGWACILLALCLILLGMRSTGQRRPMSEHGETSTGATHATHPA